MNKFMLRTTFLSIATALVLGTVGCSSGGGDGATTATVVDNSGTGIDGILVGSTVCIDVNNNSACDTGEDSTETDQDGKFNFSSSQEGPLLLIGGQDIGTGLPFTGSLKAPAGSTVITPLTSAVQALVDGGQSAADAEASVKTALGLPDIDLTNFDPLEAINDANATNAGFAQEILAKQAHLQTIVHAAAATVAGADGTTEIADVMSNVFEQIVENLDDLSAENVAAATKAVATEVYSAPDKLAAQVAVKFTAEAAATNAVATAETTRDDIEVAAVADATLSFNAAVTLANTSLEAQVEADAAAAQVAADALAPADLAAIAAAQAAADTAAAEIAAAEAAEAAAAQAAADAEAAYLAAQDKATYDAYLEALAEEARQAAAAQAAADAAAVAAAEAAAQEAQIAANAAAAQIAADAELLAAQEAAAAQAAADALAVVAAEQVAADALAAADLAAAQAAALAAEQAAALAIAQANAVIEANNAAAFAVQAETDNDVVIVIAGNYTIDANITTTASTAAADARQAADDANAAAVAAAADTNATDAQAEVVLAQGFVSDASDAANTASTALTAARAVVIAADIAEAQRVAAIQVNILEIAGYVVDANVSANSAEANATKAEADADAALALATDNNNTTVVAVVDSAALARTAATNARTAATNANVTVDLNGTAADAAANAVTSSAFAATAATEAATAVTAANTTASNLVDAVANEATVLGLIAGYQTTATAAANAAGLSAAAAELSAADANASAIAARAIANTNGDADANATIAEAASGFAATAASLSIAASSDAAAAKLAADAATNEVVAEAQADAATAAAGVASAQAGEAAVKAAEAEVAYQNALTIENARIAAAIATSQGEAAASLAIATTKAGEADANATTAETLATNAEAAAALDSAAAADAADARTAATAARAASNTAATALTAATNAKTAADAATTEAAAATAASDAATAATDATTAAATATAEAANAQAAYDAAALAAALAVAQTEAGAAATAAATAADEAEANAIAALADKNAVLSVTIHNTAIDSNITVVTGAESIVAQAALDARAASDSAALEKDAADATTDIPTAEAAALNAAGFKDTAVTEAGTASTQAGIANAARVAVDTEVARVTAAIADFRTTAQTADTNASAANTAAAGYATQARSDADAAQVIADSNANAQAAANTAEAAALAAQAEASDAVTAAGDAAAANTAAIAATTEADAETAANAATAAATAAVDAATEAGVQAANAAAALVSAQNATPPVASDSTWYDGKTLHGFWMDSDGGMLEIKYEDILLSGGTINSIEYAYDKNSTTWIEDTSTDGDDITLNTSTGAWEVEQTETYVIDANNSIMTLNGYEQIRIDSVSSLGGLTVPFETDDGSITIPVTFSAGALKYNISFKVIVETYSLDWTPTDWNTGAAYTSLEDYMNTNGNFYYDNLNNIGVQAERNVDGNLSVNSNGDPIDTLTFGETGRLVEVDWQAGTQIVVGTWEVVNLPNQTALTVQAVLDTNATNYDAYMEYGEKSATMYDAGSGAIVHMVEFQTAMTDFVAETDGDAMGNDIAIADIKAAVEAYDFSVIDVAAYFESGTKYFINENTIMGERTFYDVNSTYTGVVNGSAESGTYSVTNNVMTLIRDSDGSSYEFTYLNPTEYGNGQTFSLSINGNPAIETYNYSSDADRADGMAAATAFMKDFFIGTQKFYLNEDQGIGDRTFSAATGTTVPYTGTYTGNVGGTPVDGSYTIFGDTMRLDRTGGAILVFEHTGATTDLSVNTFSLSVNGGAAFVTTNYASQTDRDAALAATTWTADLGSITEADFIAITQNFDPTNTTWFYVEDENNYEVITISSAPIASDGYVQFSETVNGSIADAGTVYYTVDNVAPYGSVVGIQESDGNATYVEYVKFFDAMDQAALTAAFPNITWSAGAVAVKNAGISAVDSFDPWTDAGTFATVSYTDFSSLITGMTYGNSSVDDDGFITGNGQDALVFASTTVNTDQTGDVVVASSGEAAGTFAISNVDGVSTLVVTITHVDFMEYDDHIAFQYTDIGDGIAMYRGNIYDRWSDLLLNEDAKNDVFTFLGL